LAIFQNMSKIFTHLDSKQNPGMVDVGSKAASLRNAKARAIVELPDEVMQLLQGDEIKAPKGPVFQTAILAGIMAAKKTSELIPLCHPLGLDHIELHIEVQNKNEIIIVASASLTGKTGVEMEALTAVSIAALTVYDMCKALSHNIVVREICLMEKSGGKNDFRRQV